MTLDESRTKALELIETGVATSRTDLASMLGLAPSTVSGIVNRLIDDGEIIETGEGESTGGRRPRILQLTGRRGVYAVCQLGGRHARYAICDSTSAPQVTGEIGIDIGTGPNEVLEQTHKLLLTEYESGFADRPLAAVAYGFPGPVDVSSGTIIGPARMPGWNGFRARDELERRFGVPAVVDNDANVAALGEQVIQLDSLGDFIYIKAGTGIGCGLIVDGKIYRGGRGLAGDITHVRVHDGGDTPCTCGNLGCLETVASGAALVRTLRAQGLELHGTADVVQRCLDADPTVTTQVRYAGGQLGEVLATIVNFFNPNAVIVGGALGSLDPYVAALRSTLYERCLPLCTQQLEISSTVAGADAGVLGLGRLAALARTHRL